MRDADDAATTPLFTCLAFGHALPAQQVHPDELRAPLGGHDPRAILPWWVVAHVLAVPTLELCDPMAFVIGVEHHDPTRDRIIRPVHGFQVRCRPSFRGDHITPRSRDE